MSYLPATVPLTDFMWKDDKLCFIFHPWTLCLMLFPSYSHSEKLTDGPMCHTTSVVSLPFCNGVTDTPLKHIRVMRRLPSCLSCDAFSGGLEEEEAHCVHNSPAAFVKTRICAEANDPHEINGSIKEKNPQFARAWRDPLTLINHQMTDNQQGGGSSVRGALQWREKVTSLCSVQGDEHYTTIIHLCCTVFTLMPKKKYWPLWLSLIFFSYSYSNQH